MTTHAILSPSSASRWLACPASVALTRDLPDTSSRDADLGTAAHALAEMCLTFDNDTSAYAGRIVEGFEVDDEMVEAVQRYLDYVRSIKGDLLVEQRLPITPITGEPDAFGTSDAVILADDELVIVDLKYGKGVKVDADRNEQLAIYALAALLQYEFLGDFKRVRLVIVQPRLQHISEWAMDIEGETSLMKFARNIEPLCKVAMQYVADAALPPEDKHFGPSEKACRWCKAKATCPALAKKVEESVGADFEVLGNPDDAISDGGHTVAQLVAYTGGYSDAQLSTKMQAVALIEDWCKAVRAEVERRLLAGQPVPGYKLVEGRRGARKWVNESEVEEALKSMRLKEREMYDWTLISPTTAEKLAKAGTIGPRQWPKLQSLITQSEGKPSVAPESDKRQAISVTAVIDEFETVEDLL